MTVAAVVEPSTHPALLPLSLHDSLALGDVELGLTAAATTTKEEEGSNTDTSSKSHSHSHSDHYELEEIYRLPVLLRLLSASRPLSSVPSFWDDDPKRGNGGDDNDATTTPETSTTAMMTIDQLANDVVARLEDVAATYSVAEGVDVVACHLAPSICRNLSKVAPLKRKRRDSMLAALGGKGTASANNNSTGKNISRGDGSSNNDAAAGWETQELMQVGANPRSSVKRRRLSQTAIIKNKPTDSADDIHKATGGSVGVLSEGVLTSDDDNNNHDGTASAATMDRRYSRRGSEPSDAAASGAVDSQEEIVSKTLSDLTGLVASSLEPIQYTALDDHPQVDADNANANNNNNRDGGGSGGSSHRKGKLLLAVVDSALSDPVRAHSAADSVRGVMTGSDLGSTVAALMHHAPVLRHQHVANALCRAALPQTADLVKRMGANCPSAVPALLRGCIDAYKSAVVSYGATSSSSHRHTGIANSARAAILALANLSEREKSRVRTVLQGQSDGIILIDLQLTLAMSQDRTSALCLLLQYISTNHNDQRNDLSLETLLRQTPDLLIASIKLLEEEARLIVEGDSPVDQSFGSVCILTRCWIWLMVVVECDFVSTLRKGSIEHGDGDGAEALSSLLTALQDLGDKIQESSKSPERPLALLFCASMLTRARLSSVLGIGTGTDQTAVLEKSTSWMHTWFKYRSHHADYYGTMVARVLCSVRRSDTKKFRRLCQNILSHDVCPGNSSITFSPELEQGVLKSWEGIEDIAPIESLVKEKLSLVTTLDASAFIDFITLADKNHGDLTEEIKAQLTSQLGGTTPISRVSRQKMPELIVKAASYFATQSTINIPIISPLELESNAAKLDLLQLRRHLSTENFDFTFFYQVLYWFAYMDAGANSLFEFDVRILPLKEMLSVSRRLAFVSPDSALSLGLYLEYFVGKYCPEVLQNLERWELVKDSQLRLTALQKAPNRATVKRQLSSAMKAAMLHDAKDQSVAVAEKTFIFARGLLGDNDLCTQVVGALLAAPNTPSPFFTYSTLCRDPLVLLKVPIQAWRHNGLRRIILSLTMGLLEANNVLSLGGCSAGEFIAARNLLLTRGLLVAVSGSEDGGPDSSAPHVCTMTTNFLRKMIANNRGLAGLLVKQSPALPDGAQDWLVEFVPETMDDAPCLLGVFTERGSVAARLTAAAAIVRIAIAHGHRDEATAERLVYAALAQLVSSFFLVVGPVGVPVNVLIGDGSLDVTQTSRKAAFRCVRSLVNVRGRQRARLRNECGMAMHKLAGLCKDQNSLSGVAGAVVSKRKLLLRELFEILTKAANGMGSGIDL